MSIRPVLVAVCVLMAGACGSSADGPLGGASEEAADRLGLFVRTEGDETTLWLDVDGAVWLRSSRCSDGDLVGVERDGVYYPVSIHGPGVCGAAGDAHPITGPFPIDRSNGVTVTLGGERLAFARATELPLDPAFTAGPLAVTDSPAIALEDGTVRLQLDGDRLRGVTRCQSFETSLERRGSLLATGDLRHSADCPDDEPLLDVLANRTLAALVVDGEMAILGGPNRFVVVRPADGEALGPADRLDRTIHRSPAPITGEFHALTYEMDGETRATAEGYPFRIVLSDDGASWYADCNESTAAGRWEGDRLAVHDASITAVGCELPQGRDLALTGGFRLAQQEGHWTLTEGSLTIVLTAGPPIDPEAPIPAGAWAGAGIGWSPFSFSGSDGGTVRLIVDDAGRAMLDTGCRLIPLDLSPGAPALAGGDLPPSTCGLGDAPASIDAWAASIVTAERAGAYLRSGQLVLSGGGRSIELALAGS